MPRFRYAKRGMVLTISILALIAIAWLAGRSYLRWRQAVHHEAEARRWWAESRSIPGYWGVTQDALSAWHAKMAVKYRSASRRPWMGVEPDEGEPEW